MSEPNAGDTSLFYWEFIAAIDGSWIWRTTRSDGAIVSESSPFGSMEQVVLDAKRNGFDVDADHWSVTANGQTSSFEPRPTDESVTDSAAPADPTTLWQWECRDSRSSSDWHTLGQKMTVAEAVQWAATRGMQVRRVMDRKERTHADQSTE